MPTFDEKGEISTGYRYIIPDTYLIHPTVITATNTFSYLGKIYAPKKIIYNDPATVVFWKDGTKTVVKKMPGEEFNKYTAFCAALAKRIFGTNSAVNRIVNSGIDQQQKDICKQMNESYKKAKKEKEAHENH